MSFDERLVLIFKWLVALALFMCVVMPFQVLWFVLFPFIMMVNKKARRNSELQSDMHFFSPIEWFGKLAKRFLGLDE